MLEFLSFLLSSIIGGSFVTTVSTVLLERWKEGVAARLNHELDERLALLNHEFEKQLTLFQSNRNWKEQALVELYGPLIMQFDRTERAFQRYRDTDLFLEAEVLRNSNRFIRDLLLNKGHFLSPDLIDPAGKLIEHYDVWLAEYENVRKPDQPDLTTTFVYAGPKGYRFPREAQQAFYARFAELQQELYPGMVRSSPTSSPRSSSTLSSRPSPTSSVDLA